MREIKFRAWDKERKVMLPPVDVWSFGIDSVEKKCWSDSHQRLYWINDDVTLMQYTGLKDKNGKEIYEGDIVRSVHPDNETDTTTDTKIMTVTDIRGDYQCLSSEIPFTWDNRLEVIGNVYQNPELGYPQVK